MLVYKPKSNIKIYPNHVWLYINLGQMILYILTLLILYGPLEILI